MITVKYPSDYVLHLIVFISEEVLIFLFKLITVFIFISYFVIFFFSNNYVT